MRGVDLYHGDSREILELLPDNSLDSCVTDPPYALVSIVKRFGSPNAAPARGNDAYMRASAGFMGKSWDTGECAMDPAFWAEVLRVLKPGAHLAAFGATRGYHRMACAIEDAGFEIRDSLAWMYGTGFPKSHNLHGEWEGWGTALKPAFEPIVLARKPLSEGTVAANVLRWGTGALNIGATRVEYESEADKSGATPQGRVTSGNLVGGGVEAERKEFARPELQGRWPANVVHDGSDEVVGAFPVTTSVGHDPRKSKGNPFGGDNNAERNERHWNDESKSAARFFYSAKASKADRAGSKHPTVKPVSLMEWLCTLITPPGGTVLDPFAGSGTTGAAARNKGFRAVLIEREDEYVEDIKRRLSL